MYVYTVPPKIGTIFTPYLIVHTCPFILPIPRTEILFKAETNDLWTREWAFLQNKPIEPINDIVKTLRDELP